MTLVLLRLTNLVHWRRRGVGKHFDILEYRKLGPSGRPVSGAASGPSIGLFPMDAGTASTSSANVPGLGSFASSSSGQCTTSRRDTRVINDQGPGRKLFKLSDGKIIRIRDNLPVSDISTSSHVGAK